MSRWKRILTHRWFDERDARRLLGPAALNRLTEQVSRSEQLHDGEIRLCIEAALPWRQLWRGESARQRAVDVFSELRVWDTEHNNGVLIYLLLAEHRIEIVADRGLHRLVGAAQWQEVMAMMRVAFRRGEFEAGLNTAIDAVDALLAQHFPLAPGETNPNELPDRPDLR